MTEPDPQNVERQSGFKRWLPLIITFGLMLFIFGVVLPQFIDYDAAFRAIGNIGLMAWLTLAILAAWQFIPTGWLLQASLPGSTLKQGVTISTVTSAVANIPPGGIDLIVRFHMSKGWGFSTQAATASTIMTWVFDTTSKLLMPMLAVLALSVVRIQNDDVDFLAILGLAVVLVGGVLIAIGLRSTSFVSGLGRFLTRVVHFTGRVFRRDWAFDLEQGLLEFRDTTSDVLKTRWHVGILAGLANQLTMFLVMLTAVRGVGLSSEQIGTTVVFAAVAVVAVVTTIPIFNAPGLNEALYISILSWAAGSGVSDEIAAAVFVFRLVTWLVPIPIGGISYTRWKERSGVELDLGS